METSEYLQRTIEDDSAIIVLKRHKTSRTRGPAQVVLKSNSYLTTLLEQYHENIRSTLTGQNAKLQERFFILQNGGEYGKVYEYMQRVAKHFNVLLPTPMIHRKVITTDASETVPAEMLESIQDHMAHSKRTSDKFYQLRTTKKTIKAQKAIKTIIDSRYVTSTQDK